MHELEAMMVELTKRYPKEMRAIRKLPNLEQAEALIAKLVIQMAKDGIVEVRTNAEGRGSSAYFQGRGSSHPLNGLSCESVGGRPGARQTDGEMTMTDNTIDIGDRLPPEVRKPWRDKLPEAYAKHIDELLALEKDVRAMKKRLGELKDAIAEVDHREATWAVDHISEAIVLLGCAEEKLLHTTPTEEIMPKESIRQFWR